MIHTYRPQAAFQALAPGDSLLIADDYAELVLHDLRGTPEQPIYVHPTTLLPHRLGRLVIHESCEYVQVNGLQNLIICPFEPLPEDKETPLVQVEGIGNVIKGCLIQTAERAEHWHAEDWQALARDGIQLHGQGNAAIGNLIRYVRHGIEAFGVESQVLGNLYRDYCGDGIRLLNHGLEVAYNMGGFVHVGNPNEHRDHMQAWQHLANSPVEGCLRELRIHHNRFYNPPDYPEAQGGLCFDGRLENAEISHNTIITNHAHGLTIASAQGCTLIGNLIAHSDPDQGSWLMLGTRKPNHPECVDNELRANLAQRYELPPNSCKSSGHDTNAQPNGMLIAHAVLDMLEALEGRPAWL
jgi:hypothetical protein